MTYISDLFLMMWIGICLPKELSKQKKKKVQKKSIMLS